MKLQEWLREHPEGRTAFWSSVAYGAVVVWATVYIVRRILSALRASSEPS